MPRLLASKGIQLNYKILDQKSYRLELKKKLLEESQEVFLSLTLEEVAEELGDVLEVVRALSSAYGISFEQIEGARLKKKEKRGTFQGRVYCKTVEMMVTNDNRQQYDYFRSNPEKYPEMDPSIKEEDPEK